MAEEPVSKTSPIIRSSILKPATLSASPTKQPHLEECKTGASSAATTTATTTTPLLRASRLAPATQSSQMVKSGPDPPASSAATASSGASFLKASKLTASVASIQAKTASSGAAPATGAAEDGKPRAVSPGFIPLTKEAAANPAPLAAPANDSSASTAAESAEQHKSSTNGGGKVDESHAKTGEEDQDAGGAFVFGQNLTDRAKNFVDKAESPPPENKPNPPASSTTAASAADEKKPQETLGEAAARYCETHSAPKRKFDEVTPVTGEENDRNVLQMNAKLHVFEKSNSSWVERGRGTLRLNDCPSSEESGVTSRIVMRTAGSLRVILNTPLCAGMPVEKPTEKNIRLTGTVEDGQARIFLLSGAAKDIKTLYDHIEQRTTSAATKRKKVEEDE